MALFDSDELNNAGQLRQEHPEADARTLIESASYGDRIDVAPRTSITLTTKSIQNNQTA